MGFSLQEAQWLVKFFRNLPGQTAPSPEMGNEEAEYMRAMEMQAAQAYGDYPVEEPPFEDFQGPYYDEYR